MIKTIISVVVPFLFGTIHSGGLTELELPEGWLLSVESINPNMVVNNGT
jgi:hypothetical protein